MEYKIKAVTKKETDNYHKLSMKLIGIEFDREDYNKIKDIKKWFASNVKHYSITFDFSNKEQIFETEDLICLQLSDVYKEPLQKTRIKLQDGVFLTYHLSQFKLKDDDAGLKKLKDYYKDLTE